MKVIFDKNKCYITLDDSDLKKQVAIATDSISNTKDNITLIYVNNEPSLYYNKIFDEFNRKNTSSCKVDYFSYLLQGSLNHLLEELKVI